MENSLEHLASEGIISEVIGRLKSGKEADVYVVRYGDELVAAKVYKDRAHRSFKNNSEYKEGRSVRSSRSQRAIDRGSKFGKEAAEDAWKAAEAATLYKLHAAGVRVPTPVMFLEGVLFMELVLGSDGEPAPRLIDVDLEPAQAKAAYLDMLSQLVRILSCDLIHGDLSPYNVLWSAHGPTIIDFPQIVSASQNSNSEKFFLRDAENILGHFVAIDPSLRARSGDAREIWRAYVRRELSPDFLPVGRPLPPEPRPRLADPRPRSGDRGPRPGDPRQQGGGQAQKDRGARPQHEGRPRNAPNQPRGPQNQHDGRQGAARAESILRGSLHQQDGRPRGSHTGDGRPRPEDGRGPQQAGNRMNRAEPPRVQGGQRGSAPEVIVMTRRSPEPGQGEARRKAAPENEPPRPDRPGRRRPRRRG